MNAITTKQEAAADSREWSEWARDWAFEATEQGGHWRARLPFRDVYAEGGSRDEAIAGLFRVYCQLARDGSINVERPHKVGAPPIQHAIEILQEQLRFHTTCRYDDWTDCVALVERNTPDDTTAGGAWTRDPRFSRRNEVIGGLATAIAALARVKEL